MGAVGVGWERSWGQYRWDGRGYIGSVGGLEEVMGVVRMG
jgi:hypothetical protein